jgi:5,5'-dehydrodivanillate O-demethylase
MSFLETIKKQAVAPAFRPQSVQEETGMLTVEQNERLTQVGAGTPCGELMRRYWVPFAALSQLDDNPVRKVRLLGEDLVLYRDKSGQLGLIGDRCLHRRVDMQYGIPDECGLRCPYHGWLYDETGECTERPMESTPHGKIGRKLAGYPVKELGGLIFTYMGPLPAPALPQWDLFVWPNAVRQIAFNVLDCNWLQCQENTGDPTHSVWAHGEMFRYVLERDSMLERAQSVNHTIHKRVSWGVGIKELYARPTEYGFDKGVVYSKALGADEDRTDRHSTVMFPFYTQTGRTGSPRSEFQIRVPVDDTHTLHICYQVYAGPPGVEAPKQDNVPWYEPPTLDDKGRPILDYVLAQDAIVWVAQGPVVDRSQELLGRTDIPIVLLRRQLEEQIARVERGEDPMNFFREDAGMLFGSCESPYEGWAAPDWATRKLFLSQGFRKMYHKGFGTDDADRYGPALELVKELHQRVENFELAAQGEG